VKALADGAPSTVAFRIRWADGVNGVATDGPAEEAAGAETPCPFRPEEHASRLRAALQASFDIALGTKVVELVAAAPPEAMTIEVVLSPGEAGRYRAARARLPDLRATAVAYVVELRVPGAPARAVREVAALPAAVELAPVPAGEPDPSPSSDLQLKLGSTFGTSRLDDPDVDDEALRAVLRSGRVSPEVRKLLLAARNRTRVNAERPRPPRPVESPDAACAALGRAQADGLEAGIARALGLPQGGVSP
jgi:hypothetical protein